MRTRADTQTHFDLEKDRDRADQSHKDQCDINRILDKAKRTGVVTHLNTHGQSYGDFTDFDYEDAQIQIAKANSIFYDLGAEMRKEFGNNPKAFFGFVNNPENKDKLAERLPALAEPGRQLPDVVGGKTEVKPTPPQDPPSPGGETEKKSE